MQKLLKDYPNHLAAFRHARTPDEGAGYFALMSYLLKLAELEPGAVQFFGWPDAGDDGVYYVFHYPVGAEDLSDKELPGSVELDLIALQIDMPLAFNKRDAAAWAGVTLRCLENWMKGDTGKGRDPLRFFKSGRGRFFLGHDLWCFMCQYGVGETPKHYRSYLCASLYHNVSGGDETPETKTQQKGKNNGNSRT